MSKHAGLDADAHEAARRAHISLLSSSATASHSYARQVTRRVAREHGDTLPLIERALRPVWDEILRRGKLPQGTLHATVSTVLRRLVACRTLVDGRSSVTRVSPLSSNERCSARLIVAMADPDSTDTGREVDFLACDLIMTRRSVELRLDVVNFSVTSHVLARFVQRGRGDEEDFFGGIMEPMRASALLSIAASHHDTQRMLLPHPSGFLLAESVVMDDPDDAERRMPCLIRYDATGKHVEADTPTNRGFRVMVKGWSYVDADSATGVKAELHERTCAWMRDHAAGIGDWFDLVSFGSTGTTRTCGREQIGARLKAAVEAAQELSRTDCWRRFARDPEPAGRGMLPGR